MSVLEVEAVHVGFPVRGGTVKALDGVSVTLAAGETLAVVGESGCGKTTLARVVLGLQRPSSGKVTLAGRPVTGVSPGQASRVGMVWQDPYASLDPRWRVADIVAEPSRLAGREPDVEGVLREVGLDSSFADRFPHQLSGGQRQRVAIGRALALRPPLVVCDEPTAALDLSMQAQILNLLKHLKADTGAAYLYISHDLTTVRFLADRVAVMYLGRIVETGPTEAVFARPAHPYTESLIASSPTLETLGRLPDALPGEIPSPRDLPVGCRFLGRCRYRQDVCAKIDPSLELRNGRDVACLYPLSSVE